MKNATKKPECIDLSRMSRDELEDEFIKLYTRCSLAEAKTDRLLEEIRLAMQKRYGRSTEKDITGQLSLFDAPEDEKIQEDEELPKEEREIRKLVDQAVGIRKNKNSLKAPIEKKDLTSLEVRSITFVRS